MPLHKYWNLAILTDTPRTKYPKMVFLPAKSAGDLPPIPDDIPISEFMLNEKYGRLPLAASRDPFTCGFSKKSYSSQQVVERVDLLARALAKEFGWDPNKGSEWDKTLGVFSLNTVSGLVENTAV